MFTILKKVLFSFTSSLTTSYQNLGLTGKISIDDSGDRSTDCSLLSMDTKRGEYEVVANYYGSEEKFVDVIGKAIQWPGGRLGR